MRPSTITGRIRAALVGLGIAGAVALSSGVAAEDWPQFRGINRDGVSPEKGLTSNWPAEGPKELWRRPIGNGYSGITVVGKRLYTMYAGDLDGQPTEFAAALDSETGEELWRAAVCDRFDNQFGNGPRATPTVDGDTVYVLCSLGNLAALSTKDGSERWNLSLTETFGGSVPRFGYSTSPLVDGKKLLVQAGGPEGKSYVALSKKSGELLWAIGDEPAGYNSTLAIDTPAGKRYVFVTRGKLMCIDGDGKEIWQHPWPRGETHAMPVLVGPNRIFASGAEGIGATLIEVGFAGDGSESVEEAWTSRFMRNHFSTSVVHDNHIYGFDNATLKSISTDDASLAWAKRGLGKGSLILADGHLIVLSDQGELLLIEATPDAYKEKSRTQALEGRCWTSPSLSGGRLYLRNNDEIVAYALKR